MLNIDQYVSSRPLNLSPSRAYRLLFFPLLPFPPAVDSGRVRSPMPQTSGKKIGGQGQAGSARSQFFIDQLRSSIEGDDTVTPGRPFPTKGYLVKEDTGGSVDKPCPTGGARKGGEGQEGKEISGNPKSEGNGGKGKSGKNKKKKSRGKGGKKKRGGR